MKEEFILSKIFFDQINSLAVILKVASTIFFFQKVELFQLTLSLFSSETIKDF